MTADEINRSLNISDMLGTLQYQRSLSDVFYLNGINYFFETWKDYAPRLCTFLIENYDIIRYDEPSWVALRKVFGDEMERAQKERDKHYKLAEIKEAATGYVC